MKTMLIGFVTVVAVLAWRGDELANMLSSAIASKPQNSASLGSLMQSPAEGQRPMTLEEFAELSKTDPAAYQKLLASHQAPVERTEIDKLMNFLARGKYE